MEPEFSPTAHSFNMIALYSRYQSQIPSTLKLLCIACLFNGDYPIYSFCTGGSKCVTNMPVSVNKKNISKAKLSSDASAQRKYNAQKNNGICNNK